MKDTSGISTKFFMFPDTQRWLKKKVWGGMSSALIWCDVDIRVV
jgi:hypothetical protein